MGCPNGNHDLYREKLYDSIYYSFSWAVTKTRFLTSSITFPQFCVEPMQWLISHVIAYAKCKRIIWIFKFWHVTIIKLSSYLAFKTIPLTRIRCRVKLVNPWIHCLKVIKKYLKRLLVLVSKKKYRARIRSGHVKVILGLVKFWSYHLN